MGRAGPEAMLTAANDGNRTVPHEFEALLESYRALLIQQAFDIIGNREDAEDVVQETMVEACKFKEKFKAGESIVGWLQTANKANALDSLRTRKRESKRVEAKKLIHETSFTTGGFSRFELKETLKSAITGLPAEKQTVINLRYWEHKTCGEISQQLGMPEGSVRRILFEASVLLFRRLKVQIPTSDAGVNEESPTAKQEPAS